jgi:Gas vesicle synthesis protein GvpL/GvpF
MPTELKSGAQVCYLYGISQTQPHPGVQQIGVASSRIEAIEFDGLACWVSKVPAAEFEEKLSDNMQNLDWVAETSVAHQRAISAIATATDILPARLATVFRSEDSLRRHIRKEAAKLKSDLARVKGADEWGIKVFAQDAPTIPLKKVSSGKDYLKAKAALLPKRQDKTESSRDVAELANALGEVALDSAAPGKVSSGQKRLAFQTSILVRRSDRTKLESILNRFSKERSESWRIECSGPWPPYSFVSRVEPE